MADQAVQCSVGAEHLSTVLGLAAVSRMTVQAKEMSERLHCDTASQRGGAGTTVVYAVASSAPTTLPQGVPCRRSGTFRPSECAMHACLTRIS